MIVYVIELSLNVLYVNCYIYSYYEVLLFYVGCLICLMFEFDICLINMFNSDEYKYMIWKIIYVN